MNINIIFDSSVANAPAGFTAAINYVANLYDALFTNPVSISIDVGWGEVNGAKLASTDLGESLSASETGYSYQQIRDALITNGQSSTQVAAYANLPIVDPTISLPNYPTGSTVYVVPAEAEALGLISSYQGPVGYVGFSSTANFSYAANATPASDAYYFTSIAEHEISEVMGRVSEVNRAGLSVMDLFRYSAPGVFDFTATPPNNYANAYFSTDAGNTALDYWNTDSKADYGDWSASAGQDAFLAAAEPGAILAQSPTDTSLLNVIGWNVAASGTNMPTASSNPQITNTTTPTGSLETEQFTNASGQITSTWQIATSVGIATIDAGSASNAGWVRRLYLSVLDREPEPAGFQFYLEALNSGAQTRTQVASTFPASTEYQSDHGSQTDAQFVTFLYNHVLGRAPDPVGYNLYLQALASQSRGVVLETFLDSPEAQNLWQSRDGGPGTSASGTTQYNVTIDNTGANGNAPYGAYTFGAGVTASQLSFNQNGADLVVNVAGSPSEVTVTGWFANAYSQVQSFVTGDGAHITYGSTATGSVETEQFTNASGQITSTWQIATSVEIATIDAGSASNAGWVRRLYLSVLDREPEPAGFQFYLEALNSGAQTRTQVASTFPASTEYQSDHGSQTDAQFVTFLYNHVLGRAPDPVGYNLYLQALASQSRGVVLETFLDSPEAQNLWQSRDGGPGTSASGTTQYNVTIDNTGANGNAPYGAYTFGAGVTASQLSFNQNGADLVVNVAGSPSEVTVTGWFANAYSQVQSFVTGDGAHITYGSTATGSVETEQFTNASGQITSTWQIATSVEIATIDAGSASNAGWVRRLYLSVLDREPEPAGFQFYLEALNSGAQTRTQVASTFPASTEYQSDHGSQTDAQFVTFLYNHVLGRAPDPVGYNLYLQALASQSRGVVLETFLDSPEAQNLWQSRDGGPGTSASGTTQYNVTIDNTGANGNAPYGAYTLPAGFTASQISASQNGSDLVIRDGTASSVTIAGWFNNAYAQLRSIVTSDGVQLIPVAGSAQNLYGTGGHDLFYRNPPTGQLSILEFNNQGAIAAGGGLSYVGGAPIELDGFTSLVGTGRNLYGSGGFDVFLRYGPQAQLAAFEVNSQNQVTISGVFSYSNGAPLVIGSATTIIAAGQDTTNGQAAILLQSSGGPIVFVDLNGNTVTPAASGAELETVKTGSGGPILTFYNGSGQVTSDPWTITNGSPSNNVPSGSFTLPYGFTLSKIAFAQTGSDLVISDGTVNVVTVTGWFAHPYSQLQSIVTNDGVAIINTNGILTAQVTQDGNPIPETWLVGNQQTWSFSTAAILNLAGNNDTLTALDGSTVNLAASDLADTINMSNGVVTTPISLGGAAGIILTGTGDTVIVSGSGNTVVGMDGDTLVAGAGAGQTTLIAKGSGDTLVGNAAGSILNGAGGSHVVASYALNNASVNLATNTASLAGLTLSDMLVGITAASVSGNGDRLTGGAGGDTLTAAGSNAVVTGNPGLVANTLIETGSGNTLIAAASNGDTLQATGSGFHNVLVGGAGASTLIGDTSANTLIAGSAQTVAYYNVAGAKVTLGAAGAASSIRGADILENFSAGTINGAGSTLTASLGPETLNATGTADTLIATGAGQTLVASGANDVAITAGGDLAIAIGAGGNTLVASGSGNTLQGGAGSTLIGNFNGNTLEAGMGSPVAVFSANSVVASLLSGTAVLSGMSDTLVGITNLMATGALDTLIAGGPGQTLVASGVNDVVMGAGSDVLTGSGSGDIVTATGDGNTLTAGAAGVTLKTSGGGLNTLIAGSGVDTLLSLGVGDTLVGNALGSILRGTPGFRVIASYSQANVNVNLVSGRAGINGNGLSDMLVAVGGATVSGANDAIVASSKGQILSATGTNDVVTAFGGDTLTASNTFPASALLGNTLVAFGAGNTLIGGKDTTLIGNAGGNTLESTLIAGTLTRPVVVYSASNLVANLKLGNATVAGSGISDTLIGIAILVTTGNSDTLAAGAGGQILAANGENALLTSAASGYDLLIGDGSGDVIIGSGPSNTLLGGAGSNETLTAVSGPGGGGGSVLLAGAGDHQMLTAMDSLGSDTLIAGSGIDTLSASGPNDTLMAGSGSDILLANAAADILIAGAGSDTLSASAPTDIYQFAAGDGATTIINAVSSPTSSNELSFTGVITDNNLWLIQSGNNLQIDLMGTKSEVTVQGWFSNSSSQLTEIVAGGLKLDSQVTQLVQAMATYSASNPGFDPTAVAQAPSDANLQTAIAAAWHH